MLNLKKRSPDSIQDILVSLGENAYGFLKKEIGGKNAAAKKSLEKAVQKQKIEIKSFEDANIDFLTFDWRSVERDRHWWWQMQALPFLDWFARSHLLFNKLEQEEMFDYSLSALAQWLDQESSASLSPLRWHDHATAYRLSYLTNWLTAVSSIEFLKNKLVSLESDIDVLGVISEHVNWLSEEKNYSEHTNHGFDQAMAVFSLGLYTGKSYWLKQIDLAEERLTDEIKFAFTEEGVHKENSPGYQVFMMRRLNNLVRLEQLGETALGLEAKAIQVGADRFLEAITLPDGTLPMVGDTRGGQKGRLTKNPVGPVVYDFSKSGYVVIKGLYKDKPYYLLFKNCHDSNYHRHDDDLSVYFYYDGRVVLGDGGLGYHKEDDFRRKFLRSCEAHSVPYLYTGRAIRDRKNLRFLPKINVQHKKIVGESWWQGECVRRVVDFSAINDGQIDIYDERPVNSFSAFHQNFYSCLRVDRCDLGFYLSDENSFRCCIIKDSSEVNIYGYNGNAFCSFNYGEFLEASSFGFNTEGNIIRSRLILGGVSC